MSLLGHRIYTFDKSLYFPFLRPWADSNPYTSPAYWIVDQRPDQLSHLRAQKIGWAEEFLLHSFMVCLNSRRIQLNYSTGSLVTLFQPGGGGGIHPVEVFPRHRHKCQLIDFKLSDFKFHYQEIIWQKIKFIVCQGVTWHSPVGSTFLHRIAFTGFT